MSERRRMIAFALICFHVLVPVALLWQHKDDAGKYSKFSDAARFAVIANAPGQPYVDQPVEYPPLAVTMFKWLGAKSFRGFILRLILLQAACDALIAWCVLKGWGSRAALGYLALSIPLLPHCLTKFDLVAVAIAVAGAALVKRGRPIAGGALVAVGALVKIWPAVLVPVFAAQRQWRAAIAALTGLALGSAAWIAYSGFDGPKQVLTYRSARGWHTQSIVGSLLYSVRRQTPEFIEGTWRVGNPAAIWSALLTVGLVATVAAACLVAVRRTNPPDGLLETAVIAATLAWATLFSIQFVAWILPFVAIAGARGLKRVEWTTGALVILTALLQVVNHSQRARPSFVEEMLGLARNATLVMLLAFAFAALLRLPLRKRSSDVEHAL